MFDNVGDLVVSYDSGNHLPTGLVKNLIPGVAEINLAGVLRESNFNLFPTSKLPLHWHCCFGHKSMFRIQAFLLVFPFLSEIFKAASRCDFSL